jgi:DnaJ-class molecular chaperone
MYVEALNLNIENIDKYTREEIKNIYKKIALECHPDKLINITEEVERAAKIERFKKASIGYKKAIEDFDNYGKLNYCGTDYNFDNLADDYEIYNSFDLNFWKNTYDGIFKDKEMIKNTFIDVAGFFFNRGFKNKNYYNPSTKIIKHNINLPITYFDLCTLNKRKLRILLKNVKEPVYITLCCKTDYPCLTRQYIDDDSIEHEIVINMIIDNDDDNECDYESDEEGKCDDLGSSEKSGCILKDIKYTHIIQTIQPNSNSNNKGSGSYKIDLYIAIDINILEYLVGGVKKVKYVDGTVFDIDIEPFSTSDIVIKNKGLLGGNLNVKLVYRNIRLKDWEKISVKKRERIVNLMKKMYT